MTLNQQAICPSDYNVLTQKQSSATVFVLYYITRVSCICSITLAAVQFADATNDPERTRHTMPWFDGLNQAVVIKRLIVLSSSQFISCVGSHGACHHGEITQMLSRALPTHTQNLYRRKSVHTYADISHERPYCNSSVRVLNGAPVLRPLEMMSN